MLSESFPLFPQASWGIIAPTDEYDDPLHNFDAVLPVQTHTANVGILTSPDQIFPDTDAIITTIKGVAIAVRTADCVPIVLYAPDIEAIAAVHAGWKGTIAGIAPKTVRILIDMGADPSLLQIRIGPHICHQCYEVDPSLAALFENESLGACISYPSYPDPLNGKAFNPRKPHLDLGKANSKLMEKEAGCHLDIKTLDLCTRHSNLNAASDTPLHLPSWRRSPGEERRIITWIRLKS